MRQAGTVPSGGPAKEAFSVPRMAHAFEQATGFGKKRPAIA